MTRMGLGLMLAAGAFAPLGEVTAEADCGAVEDCPAWQLSFLYTGEFWRNADGGVDEGDAYLDNADLTLEVDGGRAFGLPGLTLFGYLLYNNGQDFTGRYVGDIQGVSNIETGVKAVRLYELWADWNFGAESDHSFRVGLYDFNAEFDANESASLFINSAHGIGTEIAQTGENGPSIFPVTSLAARYRWQPAEAWALQLAVLDGVPGDPDHPKRTTVDLSHEDGAFLAAELQHFGPRVRKAALGYWQYTADFPDLLRTDGEGEPREGDGNNGLYAFADVIVFAEAEDDTQGMTAWVRYGGADDDYNQFDRYLGAGVVYTGLIPGRDADQIGLALAQARTGKPYRTAADLAGISTDHQESHWELTYRAGITDWLTIQPNVQYVRNPGTDPELDDATVFGLRFEVGWGWAR